jgi:hypothetical protein
LAAALALSCYYDWRHLRDRRWLAETAHRVVESAGARTPRERAMALRDFVRSRVTFRGAQHDGRPFLRATARETLESGLGYCGESTRTFVLLAKELGLEAQRVNLRGELLHVVAEVQLEGGRRVLVDPQNNPETNVYFDPRDTTVEELTVQPGSPFRDYSNLNLRRVPLLGTFVQRVKMEMSWLTWALECPELIKASLLQCLVAVAIVGYAADRMLCRMYARRLGVVSARVSASSPPPPGYVEEPEFDPLALSPAG